MSKVPLDFSDYDELNGILEEKSYEYPQFEKKKR